MTQAQKTLTAQNAEDGLMIISKAHPEWGSWQMIAGERWEIKGRSGRRILNTGEFHFWALAI